MTLLIDKKSRTFEFINTEEESPYHISHLCQSSLSKSSCFEDKNCDDQEYQKNIEFLKSLQYEKSNEENKYDLPKVGLKNELIDEFNRILSNKKTFNKTTRQLTEREQTHQYKFELEQKKLLIPCKPVWDNAHCYGIEDWLELYDIDVENIYNFVVMYIAYLRNNGYDVLCNEKELFYRVVTHVYKTSENVQKQYISLR